MQLPQPSWSLKRAATNWCLDRDRHDDRGLYCVPCARRHHDFCVSKSRYLWRKRHKRSKTSLPNLYGPPWDDFWERMIPRPGFSTAYRAYTRAVGVNVVGSAAVAASINAAMKSLCQNRRAPRRPGRSGQEKAFRQEERARDGRAAMTEYKTEALAIREKAARLK